ncbi:MAG: hypothetical protein LBD02_01860 [Christensenellaceae bacterium]|jgi:hypothetical protein|nr:hypothetical protein [Christensenellaceae bacterium]
MKARLVPVRFAQTKEEAFQAQLHLLAGSFAGEAEFLPPVELGGEIPEADAALLPFLPAEAYKRVEELKKVGLPLFGITSAYGARSMWDWEEASYLRGEGVDLYTPYDVELSRVLMRAAALKREMRNAAFLIWQDEAQRGFYWYEEECARRIKERFGLKILYESYSALCERARAIPDEEARAVAKERVILKEEVRGGRLLSAIKLYMAMERRILELEGVAGIGCNCLNESKFTDTSPCLAFALLNRERGIKVVCEADTLSLLTEYIAESAIGRGSFSTNIYPFLMGLAAVRHEKISDFPQVERPENHALLVHCGYCGLIPENIASSWVLRPAVLGMLNENAVMIDGEIPRGDLALLKLHSRLDRWLLAPAELTGYARYPGSDCRCGGVIRVRDGHELMEKIYSHHITVMPGKLVPYLKLVGRLLGLENELC